MYLDGTKLNASMLEEEGEGEGRKIHEERRLIHFPSFSSHLSPLYISFSLSLFFLQLVATFELCPHD